MSLRQQAAITVRQATVIAEAVYGIQLLLKKGIITRDELKEVRETLIHADSILSPGSSLQSKEAGSDVNSGGSGESGVSGESSDRGDSNGSTTPDNSRDVSRESEQGDPDSPVGKSKVTSEMISGIELVEPTEEGQHYFNA